LFHPPRRIIISGQWIDGQFILHANNYDLEGGERSVWDQELGQDGGVRLESQPPKVAKAPRAVVVRKPKAPHVFSSDEQARLDGNRAIKESKAASEGAMRHFFSKHQHKFLPFGATIAEPLPGDLPGEDLGPDPFPQPPYIKVQMRDYQREGLRFLAQSYANGISAILGDEMGELFPCL
jgi:hypothetical protein